MWLSATRGGSCGCCGTVIGFQPLFTHLPSKNCFRCFTCYPVYRTKRLPNKHSSSLTYLRCQSDLPDEIPAEKPSLIYQKRRIPKRPVEPRVYLPFSEAEDAFLLLCYEKYKYSFKEIGMRLGRDDASISTRYGYLSEARKNKPFTPEEDERLRNRVESFKGAVPWKELSKEFDNRPYEVLYRRYFDILEGLKDYSPWTPEEDQKLLQLVEKWGHQWTFISRSLPGRTPYQCFYHYHWAIKPGLKKGEYSPYEDEILLKYYEKLGPKWSKIRKFLPWRAGSSLQKRWRHLFNLSRTRNFGLYTEEDDQLLLKLFSKYGRKWTKISAEFKTRSEKQLKGRFDKLKQVLKIPELEWTPEKDEKLLYYHKIYHKNWYYISQRMIYFGPKECEARVRELLSGENGKVQDVQQKQLHSRESPPRHFSETEPRTNMEHEDTDDDSSEKDE